MKIRENFAAESWQNYENDGNVHIIVNRVTKNMMKHMM